MNDPIERDDVIKVINKRICELQSHPAFKRKNADRDLYGVKKMIINLPSARPQGEWIFKTIFPNDNSEFPMGYLVCSVCGSHHSNSTPCNYCDNCGARMKGADDE